MKVLIVASGNSGYISPFINDQVKSLEKFDIDFNFFLIKGKGFLGYLMNLNNLFNKIKTFKPDLIHAHYGLSGLLCCFQFKVPVIITYHGSDIHFFPQRILSFIASRFATFNIFVSKELASRINMKKNYKIIPCGVDLEIFKEFEPINYKKDFSKILILFSSNFNRKIKNYDLAKKSINYLNNNQIELLELKGYSRNQVAELMNISNLGLLTSFEEGSPQFIKEAMACNLPIVATKVGDIEDLFRNEEGYIFASFDFVDVANKIKQLIDFSQLKGKTKGREKVISLGLDINNIAQEIYMIYYNSINKR